MAEERPPYELDTPGSQPERRRRMAGLTAAIILIALGVVMLLNNAGLIATNWLDLLRWWPLLLILIGLDIMLGRRSMIGSVAIGLVALAALGGALIFASVPGQGTPVTTGRAVSGEIAQELGDVESLEVTLDMSIAELNVGSQSGKQYAAQGDYLMDSRLVPQVEYVERGSVGELTIRQPQDVSIGSWFGNIQSHVSVNLPADVPIDLTVNAGLGSMTLDLGRLDIRTLTVESDSGTATITLPASSQMQEVHIKAGLGTVTVSFAGEGAVNLRSFVVESDSGSVNLSLPSQGEMGQVSITAGLGSVTLDAPSDASLNFQSLDVSSDSGSVRMTLPSAGDLGDVTVNAGLGSVNFDMRGRPSDLSIQSLDISSDSGSVTVTLPNKGNYEVDIETGLGSITIHVPDGFEARIEAETGMGHVEVSDNRFQEAGNNAWETSGYAGASDRSLVRASTDSGSITIAD